MKLEKERPKKELMVAYIGKSGIVRFVGSCECVPNGLTWLVNCVRLARHVINANFSNWNMNIESGLGILLVFG
jgi:hypothetical protein